MRSGTLRSGAGHPIMVNGRYVATPSPIPSWDVPNLSMARCLYLFGAGREKRIHCIPPFTRVEPLEFEDIRFKVEEFIGVRCSASGQDKAFMDQIYAEDFSHSWVINDSNFLGQGAAGAAAAAKTLYEPRIGLRAAMDDNWLLRVRNLTKVFGEVTPGVCERTGPEVQLQYLPEDRRRRRLQQYQLRSLSGRSSGHRRRERFGKEHAGADALLRQPMPPPAR